jgi:hypothetical protein
MTRKSAARLKRDRDGRCTSSAEVAQPTTCADHSWLLENVRCELPIGHGGRHAAPSLSIKPEWSNGPTRKGQR